MTVIHDHRYDAITHASDVYSSEEMAKFRSEGLWRDAVLTDFLTKHAAERPDADAVVTDTGDRATWKELSDAVDRLAAGLLSLGLQPGDFVGVQLPNSLQFVQTYLAIQRAGLRAVTMLSIYREKDVTFMLNKCQAKAYIAFDYHHKFDYAAMAVSIKADIPTLEHLIFIGGEPLDGAIDFDVLLQALPLAPERYAELRPDPDSISKVNFTSGTTGSPKGVVHTHNTDLVPPLLMQQAAGLGPDTPIWMPSPIAHVTGLLFGPYAALLNGAKLVLQDTWDPVRALELISAERPYVTVSATPFIAAMLEVPNRADYDLSSFKYFMSGGARIPQVLVQRARDEFGWYLLRVFGSAEAPLHTANLPGDAWEKMIDRDGRPFPGVEAQIVDPDDYSVVLPPNEQGEYRTRGPHVFLGYLDDPERTWEARSRDGWYASSDICLIDEDGFVQYIDRIKDIVNRGGIKISALEVENELLTHPAIQQAAVVAVSDERLGEKGCAFVVLRPGSSVTLEEISRHLESRHITRQKWPEALRIVDEFPTTATGKVRKIELREAFEAELGASA
jgi:non-ribosomal peptide synthetase component E (peptide arylation enzyme)